MDNENRFYERLVIWMFLAHVTRTNDGQVVEQSLCDHCHHSAVYAQENIVASLSHVAYFLGIIHDMGKAKTEYLIYLRTVFECPEKSLILRGSVNHTFASVIWILSHMSDQMDAVTRIAHEVLAYVVGAHHGLFDLCDIDGNSGLEHRLFYDKNQIHYAESVQNFYTEVMSADDLNVLFDVAIKELVSFIERMIKTDSSHIYFDISTLCRMLLSALVYGDRRDTSEFMSQSVENNYLENNWDAACDFYEQKIATFQAKSELDLVRQDISKQCFDAAARKPGIYRLNVPTGGGKTLSSFRYSLHHARLFNKRRIIYAASHITILEQNADVWRDYYVTPEYVLEHHSNVVNDVSDLSEELNSYELLSMTWDSPVILTTFVQVLDAFVSGRMSAVGHLCALANSILILDEVQNIPRKYTYIFNEVLNVLVRYFNCTVVLCSATQPCFGDVSVPLCYANVPDLVVLTDDQKQVFVRTTIVDKTTKYGMSLRDLSLFCQTVLSDLPSVLCICNTREQAAILYAYTKDMKDVIVLHLSNNMCKTHINDTLVYVKSLLQRIVDGDCDKKLLVISTQIPEAGVDVSFACVIRVLAGLDNAIQADGRCNRSYEYGSGVTYIVKLNQSDEKAQYLPDVRVMQASMEAVLADSNLSCNLLSDATVNAYYDKLFRLTKNILGYPYQNGSLFDLLSNIRMGHSSLFDLSIPFKEVGNACSVIDGGSYNVVVPYAKYQCQFFKLKQILEEQPDNIGLVRHYLLLMKHCVVNVFDSQLAKLKEKGLVHSYLDDTVYLLDESVYSDDIGLSLLDDGE